MQFATENGVEVRGSSYINDDEPPSFQAIVELCMDALTLLPEDPAALEESQKILDIIREPFKLIFEETFHGVKPLVVSPTAKQYCFVALYLKNKNATEPYQQYFEKAKALDPSIVARITGDSSDLL